MRILEVGNRGSITVEMCFVMPIVLWIMMMLINVMLTGVDEGTALGNSQVRVYECSDLHELSEENSDLRVGSGAVWAPGCKREWGVCTDRLRRWQLYGDVLCE